MDYNDLARNSEDTLTSPICFFIDFDIGCVPQALKEAVFVLCQHLLCRKPREEMKVRLEQKRQVLKQHWCFQSFSPWFLAPSFPFQAHYHTLLHQSWLLDEKSGLKRLLSTLRIRFCWLELIFSCSSENTTAHLLIVPNVDIFICMKPPGFPSSVYTCMSFKVLLNSGPVSALEAVTHEFRFGLHYFLAVKPWASYSTCLGPLLRHKPITVTS